MTTKELFANPEENKHIALAMKLMTERRAIPTGSETFNDISTALDYAMFALGMYMPTNPDRILRAANIISRKTLIPNNNETLADIHMACDTALEALRAATGIEQPTYKRVVISCGPIPAKLDSVTYLTSKHEDDLAFKTAERIADRGHEVTVIVGPMTEVPDMIKYHKHVKTVIRVNDVFEYHDWFLGYATDYDMFIMAANVTGLTPVHPRETEFPSHEYQPDDEFDIKFMIAPKTIDAIRPLNPSAKLIGYTLHDTATDGELETISRRTLVNSQADVIFGNRPRIAKERNLAVFPDGSTRVYDFDQHVAAIIAMLE